VFVRVPEPGLGFTSTGYYKPNHVKVSGLLSCFMQTFQWVIVSSCIPPDRCASPLEGSIKLSFTPHPPDPPQVCCPSVQVALDHAVAADVGQVCGHL